MSMFRKSFMSLIILFIILTSLIVMAGCNASDKKSDPNEETKKESEKK